MLSRLQCTFCLNQNNVNDYIKPCTRQSLNCMLGIMLCPGITLALATPLQVAIEQDHRIVIHGDHPTVCTYYLVKKISDKDAQ